MDIMDIIGDIKKRKIVLYGDREEILVFIQKYGSKVYIKQVITDFPDEVKWQTYGEWGIKTYLFDDVAFEDELIIICTHKRYNTFERRLLHSNRVEYRDFISQELVDGLLYGKKILVCMGTNRMKQIADTLPMIREVETQYSVVFFAENEMLKIYKNRIQEYKHVCKLCDVYIRSSCEKSLYGLKICCEKDLKPGCRIITVSDYEFTAYYPQISNNRDTYSNYFFREHERLDMDYDTLAFSRQDYIIENLCKENDSEENIANEILREDFFQEEEILSYFNDKLTSFLEKEKDDDIKIGSFIKENYRKCLCRNIDEWSSPVIIYVIDKILKKIGFDNIILNEKIIQDKIEEQSGSEMLIYPSVSKYLELDLEDSKMYKIKTYYTTRYMNAYGYTRYHIKYLKKAMELTDYARMYNYWSEDTTQN